MGSKRKRTNEGTKKRTASPNDFVDSRDCVQRTYVLVPPCQQASQFYKGRKEGTKARQTNKAIFRKDSGSSRTYTDWLAGRVRTTASQSVSQSVSQPRRPSFFFTLLSVTQSEGEERDSGRRRQQKSLLFFLSFFLAFMKRLKQRRLWQQQQQQPCRSKETKREPASLRSSW